MPTYDFPFPHNWTDPVTERIAYLTEVFDAHTDHEQRVSLRPQTPRRTFEYLFTPNTANERARFYAATFPVGAVYKVPVWHDQLPLASAVTAGQTAITVAWAGREYVAGAYVCFWRSSSNYEFKQISSVTNYTGITLTAGTTSSWAADGLTTIMPARLATLANEQQVKSYAAEWEDIPLQFEVLASEVYSDNQYVFTPDSYRGWEVFHFKRARFDWKDEGAQFSISRRAERLDNDMGLHRLVANDTGHRRTIPYRFMTNVRSESAYTTFETVANIRKFLQNREGRRVPCWVFTGEKDFEATAISGSALTVTLTGYTAYYAQHAAKRDIAFLKTDGTRVYRRISSSAIDGGGTTETLTLDSAPPALNTIERICFLRPARLAQDDVEFVFNRGNASTGGIVLETSFAFKELLTSI